MKKPIYLMLTMCALFLLGCNTESTENLENESLNGDDLQTVTIQVTDFKLVGEGVFEKSDSKSCDAKAEFYNRGESTTGEFGRLTAQFSICTDLEDYSYLTGSYTNIEGDQFWFTSDQSGIDEFGKWHQLIIDGGTGVFENAFGEITIWRTERYNPQEEEGTFTDYGKGIINY